MSFAEARQRLLTKARPIAKIKRIDLTMAANQVCAADVFAPVASPTEANAAVDGFAIDASITVNTPTRISQIIAAGDPQRTLAAGTAARIFTGALLPKGANRVIMQEHCEYNAEQVIIKQPQGNNIRQAGEDFSQGQLLLRKGERITPFTIALLAQAGIGHINILQPLKVALLTSGDELLQPGMHWSSGKVYDSNQPTIASILQRWGLDITYTGCITDDPQQIKQTLLTASTQSDLLITCGGVSVGDRDYLRLVVKDIGHIDAWKVAMKPGKPIAWGEISGKPYFGLPGNPVSAVISLLILARHAIAKYQGGNAEFNGLRIPLNCAYQTQQRCDFIRVQLEQSTQPHLMHLNIYPQQQSHIVSSLAWATGIAHIPAHKHIATGDCVDYYPFEQLLNL